MTPCDEWKDTPPPPRWGETPAASLAFWLVMAVLGYAYVAAVLTDRANPLASPPGNAYELPKLLAAATVMWLVGARKTLMPFAVPWGRAVLWIGILWAVPFFIALHYEYLGGLVGSNFSLTPRDLARMNAHDWTVFAAGTALILSLVGYHGRLAWRARIFGRWVGALAAVIAVIALVTFLRRETHTLHIHHFFFGMLVPWFRFPNPLCALCQGAFAGIAVEGVSRWGMDPTWHPIH